MMHVSILNPKNFFLPLLITAGKRDFSFFYYQLEELNGGTKYYPREG
jgi:hypothetical protein